MWTEPPNKGSASRNARDFMDGLPHMSVYSAGYGCRVSYRESRYNVLRIRSSRRRTVAKSDWASVSTLRLPVPRDSVPVFVRHWSGGLQQRKGAQYADAAVGRGKAHGEPDRAGRDRPDLHFRRDHRLVPMAVSNLDPGD